MSDANSKLAVTISCVDHISLQSSAQRLFFGLSTIHFDEYLVFARVKTARAFTLICKLYLILNTGLD